MGLVEEREDFLFLDLLAKILQRMGLLPSYCSFNFISMSVNVTVGGALGEWEKFSGVLCLAICYDRFTFKLLGSCFVLKSAPSEKVFSLWASGRVKVNCNLSVDIISLFWVVLVKDREFKMLAPTLLPKAGVRGVVGDCAILVLPSWISPGVPTLY